MLEIALVLLVLAFVRAFGNGPAEPMAPLLFAAVVLLFAFEGGPVSRLFGHPALVRLGVLSYSIYMVHAFVLLILENATAIAARAFDVDLTALHAEPDGGMVAMLD